MMKHCYTRILLSLVFLLSSLQVSALSLKAEETEVPEELLKKLQLFIDMVLIENIVDEFECAAREGEDVDYEDIEDAAESLIHEIPYAGIGKF